MTAAVKIDANERELIKSINNAVKAIEKFGNQTEKAAKKSSKAFKESSKSIKNSLGGLEGKLKKVGAAAAGIVISKLTIDSIKKAADEAGNLEKQAKKLGVTIEQLQKFRFAGEKIGLSETTVDNSLQRFVRRLGEARVGKGEAKGALERLNISIFDDLGKAREAEEVLLDIADAIQNFPDAEDKLSILFKFFDTEGVDFGLLFEGGAQGMKKLLAETEKYNSIVSEESNKILSDFDVKLKTLASTGKKAYKELLAGAIEYLNKSIDLNKNIDGFIERLGQVRKEDIGSIVKSSLSNLIIPGAGFFGNNEFRKTLEERVAQSREQQRINAAKSRSNLIKQDEVRRKNISQQIQSDLRAIRESKRIQGELEGSTANRLRAFGFEQQNRAAFSIREETNEERERKKDFKLSEERNSLIQDFKELRENRPFREALLETGGFQSRGIGSGTINPIVSISQQQLKEEKEHTKLLKEMISAIQEIDLEREGLILRN